MLLKFFSAELKKKDLIFHHFSSKRMTNSESVNSAFISTYFDISYHPYDDAGDGKTLNQLLFDICFLRV